ncbi:MAG: flavodoxin family protein [Bacteroidales bacterium]|nr:flavodoxin family protein [Bacteroidales bacterium]
MKKKIVILNASPRKDKNTATLLREAARGAEEAGAEVQYADLIDLTFTGCRSCMACKRTGNQCGGLCAVRDDLRPVLESIVAADALILGSPIYWHNTTGMFRNLIERLLFPILSYNADERGAIKNLDKKLATGLIYTMNVTPKYYEQFNYGVILEPVRRQLEAFFGHCEVLNAQGTWQFYPDYSNYDAAAVDLEEKQWYRDNQWPRDQQSAHDMGRRLVTME